MFAERSYSSVSMSDVAAAAGVTRALVHRYFPQKASLYRAVVETLVAQRPEIVRSDADVNIEALVASNVAAALDFAATYRQVMMTISMPGAFLDDLELTAVVDEAREALVDTMVMNHVGTTDVPQELRVLMRGYMGLFQATAAEWLVHERATRAQVELILTRTLLLMMSHTLPALLNETEESHS